MLTVIVYRPPKRDTNFLSEFSDFMSTVLTKYDKIILLGDFNFHVNDYNNSRAMKFLNLLACLNLVQHVQSATHIHGNILDLVITKNINVHIASVAQVPVSDHFWVFFNALFSALMSVLKS
ncbi:hypothetical protein LDENG_00167380 [Lucifuga dentata]|nr:hypothetical protein LDENG_00167380 [Lucifuga dentata]